MGDPDQLDKTYHYIMETFVKRGDAPHYAEIGNKFGVKPDEGKKLLLDLINTNVMPMWLYPDTDLMVSFAPFNNLPTQYRITVEGQQKWFAQWGLEALAVCWVFPGKSVQIDAPCLDCGESMQVVVRDGIIQNETPIGICGYTDIPRRQWEENWPFTWSRIHLFRSEGHARKWSGFLAGTEEAILPVSDMMAIMSTSRHSEKLSGHYVSSAHEYAPLFFQRLEEVTRNSAFWRPKS